MDETYQGWKNYATWGVALVLDNDRAHYETVTQRRDQLRQGVDSHSNVKLGIWSVQEALRFELADFIKLLTEALCETDNMSLMASQVIQAGLAEVDWDEIAIHYTED